MSNNQNPISVNINVDGTEFVNNTVSKVANPIATTIANMWFLTTGWLDHYADKKRIVREKNLKEFRQTIENEVSMIPDADKIEPRISIIAPAIQSSEFYFEEEHYRGMFAKLIASSMNALKSDFVHPSFVQIIQQMNHIDAILFKEISNNDGIGSVPVVKTGISMGMNNEITNKVKDMLFIKGEIRNTDFYHLSLSLNNLSRLGLIDIDFLAKFNDKKTYEFINSNTMIISYNSAYPQFPLTIQRGIINLTSLGKALKSVCL